jgi:hypothetical protein
LSFDVQALRLKGIQNFKAKDFGLKPVKERKKFVTRKAKLNYL